MATKITTNVLADDAVTDAKIADVTLTTATQSASDNSTKIATTAYVTTAIANLADSAPSTLNTLNELAAALGDDANFSTTVTNSIAAKAPLASPSFTGNADVAGNITVGNNDSILAENNLRFKSSGAAYIDHNTTSQSINFRTSNSSALDTNAMTILGSGNVGIGTSSPTEKLTVNGAILASGALQDDRTSTAAIDFTSDVTRFISYGASGVGGQFAFRTAGGGASSAEKVRINFDGKVGIGTSGPVQKLHIDGTGFSYLRTTSSSYGGTGFDIGQHTGGSIYLNNRDNTPIIFQTNNAEKMRIAADGSVGIGSNNPASNLHVETNTHANIRIQAGADSSASLRLRNDAHDWDVNCQTNDNFAIYSHTSSAERLVIEASSGNVGIGTSSPTSGTRLDVQGGYIRSKNVYMGTGGNGSKFEGGNGSYEPGTGNLLCGATGLDLNFLVVKTGVGVSTQAKVDSPSGDFYTNDGSVSSLSDERVKTDITDLGDGLEIVKQLRPVTFKYNDTSEDHEGNKRLGADSDIINYGFIAQEVEKVAPQYVKTGVGYINNEEVNDFRSMSTTRMIPMLFKAIQELEERITTLENA